MTTGVVRPEYGVPEHFRGVFFGQAVNSLPCRSFMMVIVTPKLPIRVRRQLWAYVYMRGDNVKLSPFSCFCISQIQ